MLLLGYEWLLSGLNKLLSPDFASNLSANLQQSFTGNPNGWYVSLLTRLVIPHAGLFAALVEGGEVLVALGLAAGAGWWLRGTRLRPVWARSLHLGGALALAGGALMTANYWLLAGNTLPWLKTDAPFGEGLDIDGLLTLVALALLVVHLLASRTGHTKRPGLEMVTTDRR
jgi:thiosulfate dehydrogenase [quinone] large subunit